VHPAHVIYSVVHSVLPNRNVISHTDAIFALVENGGRIREDRYAFAECAWGGSSRDYAAACCTRYGGRLLEASDKGNRPPRDIVILLGLLLGLINILLAVKRKGLRNYA
jgi:hypothetical protein